MTPNERQELETLLPWHAAGTLDPDDAARVEAALAADQELAKHFAIVREEMAETIHVNEALGSPSPRTLDKLLAAIDADPARTSRTMFGAGIGRLFAALSPQVLAWSTAIAALVIVLQAGVIATMLTGERAGPRRATFETASAPEAMPSPLRACDEKLGAGSCARSGGERRRSARVGALCARSQYGRHHTVSGDQQGERGRWTEAGRALSAAGERRR
jgi:hypothetical protein